MHDRIKQVMANTFGVAFEKIHANASINDFEEWDSLRHLELMPALELEFEVRMSTDTIVQLTSLESIQDFLRKQGREDS